MSSPHDAPPAARKRELRHARVMATQWLSPELVRITFDSPDLAGLDLPFTDHYIKIRFGEVTRTYSLRSHDARTGEIVVDFVAHGDQGLAGPWAAAAQVGDQISFHGPGGAWAPDAAYDHFVFVGDEAAAPAICAGLDALPEHATATAYLEVSGDQARFEVPERDGVDLVWVARDGAPYGSRLAATVRAAAPPEGRVGWFVHGVAEMVKDLRRLLFVERGLAKDDVSISGYWRTGMDEDGWQSSKREFNAEMAAEEQAAAGRAAVGE